MSQVLIEFKHIDGLFLSQYLVFLIMGPISIFLASFIIFILVKYKFYNRQP